jgi:hypothetical protein
MAFRHHHHHHINIPTAGNTVFYMHLLLIMVKRGRLDGISEMPLLKRLLIKREWYVLITK